MTSSRAPKRSGPYTLFANVQTDFIYLTVKHIDAVVRNFEIIGEAASRLPEDLRDKTPEVDWHKIRGLRNRIVHGYFGINYRIIWDIKEDYLSPSPNQVK